MGLPVNEGIKGALAPDSPGVYIMRGQGESVLYVGKAGNLKSRIAQYLRLQDSRAMVPRLVSEIEEIEYILTSTEKEALLLERQLVRRLRPRYNVMLRDDKNFLLVRVDVTQPWPRLELVRKRKTDGALYLGPYPSARTLREYVRFLTRAFRLRVCSDRRMGLRQRPCVLHQMGWCSCPHLFPDENTDYMVRVDRAVELLTKRRQEAEQMISAAMYHASEEERFEEAARYRDLLASLHSVWGRQSIVVGMNEDADVFASWHGPLGGVVYVLEVRDGVVAGTHSFFNEGLFSADLFDLESTVYQYYEHRFPPPLVLGDFSPAAAADLESLLLEEYGARLRVVGPIRGEKKSLLELARTNACATYEQDSAASKSRQEVLDQLSAALDLPRVSLVECVDISSFQGGDAVGTVAVARDGIPAPSLYRSFHVKGDSSNDFAMMREVVSRRLKQIGVGSEPRLLLVDGGKAHLAQVLPLFSTMSEHVFPAAIAKARPDQGLPEDRVYLPGRAEPVPLAPDSRVLLFIQALRDEAHRFSVAFHRKKRKKRTLASPLLEVPGVGKQRRLALIRHFGSLKAVAAASIDELAAVKGIPLPLARAIHEHLQARG